MQDRITELLAFSRFEMNRLATDAMIPSRRTIGEYTIEGVLGGGGTSVVYRCRHATNGQEAAVKVLNAERMSRDGLARFEREANILRRLDHPSIVRILAVGLTDLGLGPQRFIAMESVRGERLDQFGTSSQVPSMPPSIAEDVDAIGTSDAATRMRLLIELNCIDMEYRWKRLRQGTQERRLDDYHLAFPELGELRHTPMLLIEEEYRTRQRWGDHPSHSIYVKRFGERGDEKGILHCDLKPGDLVLDSHGHLKVTDFGLAISPNEKAAVLDRIAGTAPFMAPEQVSGCWGDMGHRYVGLGAVLYTLLTGRPPYTGRSAIDILSVIISGQEPTRPELLRPEVEPSLANIVAQAFSKKSVDRFPTARQFALALQCWSDRSSAPPSDR